MAIPKMALIIFLFSLGMLTMTWQSLFLTLLPLATDLRLQPFRKWLLPIFFSLGYSADDLVATFLLGTWL